MALKAVKRCPACGMEHAPQVLRCGCGALLAGVDLSRLDECAAAAPTVVSQGTPAETRTTQPSCGAPATMATLQSAHGGPAATGSAHAAAVQSVICPFPDCAQPNRPDSERCAYCNRPLGARSHAATLLWPWGERMAVEGELLVGREAPAPQSLIDRLQREFDNVSRRHALLRLVADGLWVEDLASTNGTFVNGVRLQARHAVRLSDGATVRFAADLMATVHVGDA